MPCSKFFVRRTFLGLGAWAKTTGRCDGRKFSNPTQALQSLFRQRLRAFARTGWPVSERPRAPFGAAELWQTDRHGPVRQNASLLLVLIVVGALGAAVRLGDPGRDRMLGTDEADYVRAMSLGLIANYLGSSERSGYAFVSQVLTEYRETGWSRPFQRDWAEDDAAGLRHYHPPLALYPLGLVDDPRATSERALRVVPAVTGVLAVLATAWLAFVLLETIRPVLRITLSATAAMLVALSPYHVGASVEIGAHAAFSFSSTLVLAALTMAVRHGDMRWWMASCAGIGLAVLTVPYWALLVPPAAWAWWVAFRRPRGLRSLSLGMLAAVTTSFVAWPPFLAEAAFFKPALMYAGIILRPLSSTQTPGAWAIDLFRSHVVLASLTFVGVAAAAGVRRAAWRPLAPTVLFVVGFFLLNLRVGHMKELYASDVVAPLAALSCALAGFLLQRIHDRTATIAATCVLATVLVFGRSALTTTATDPGWRNAIVALNHQFGGARVLVTPRAAGAIVKYYLPRTEIVLDSDQADDAQALRAAIASREVDFVIRWGSRAEPGGVGRGVTTGAAPDGTATVAGTVVSWWRP
jgi:hypothetical protein